MPMPVERGLETDRCMLLERGDLIPLTWETASTAHS